MERQDGLYASHLIVYACAHQESISFFSNLPDAIVEQRLDERRRMLCPSCEIEARYMLAIEHAVKTNLKTLIGSSEHRKIAGIVRYELLDMYVYERAVQDRSDIVHVLNKPLYRQSLFWIHYRAARWDKRYRETFFTILDYEVSKQNDIREYQRTGKGKEL